MTRRDWWLGVAVLALVILVHALLPRYEWSVSPMFGILRFDRWTGRTERATIAAHQTTSLPPHTPDAKYDFSGIPPAR